MQNTLTPSLPSWNPAPANRPAAAAVLLLHIAGIALLFGGLLVGRWLWGWRGRVALRWTLAGFVALMLAYVGSRFVVEVVLHRTG